MKTNEKHPVSARLTRWGLVPLGILVAALCFAGPSRAQSNAASEQAPDAQGAAQQLPALPPAASEINPRPQSALGPATATVGMKGAKGRNEHVKVSGYWKIEVHDPAGKLVSDTEFENSLTTNDPNGFSGDFALAEILGGSNAQVLFTENIPTAPTVDIIATGYTTGTVPGFVNNAKQVFWLARQSAATSLPARAG